MKMVCPSYGAIAVFTIALVLITLKINTLYYGFMERNVYCPSL